MSFPHIRWPSGERRSPAVRAGLACALLACLVTWSCTRKRITAVEVSTVEVAPPDASLLLGDSLQLSASVEDGSGRSYPNADVVWTSDDTLVARVSASGRVVGRSAGTVEVTASFRDLTGTALVRVFPGPEIGISRSVVQIFAAKDGPPPEAEEVSVFNSGPGVIGNLTVAVTYASGDPAGWLQAALGSPTAPTVLTLATDPGALPNGVHEATVSLSADGATNSPVRIAVRLTIAGYAVTESGGSTTVSESGTSDSLTVALRSQPTSDVVFAVIASDAGEASASPTALTFTPESWSTPQTIVVTGVDDPVVDGDQVSTIRVSVDDAASDDAFDGLPDRTVLVTNGDDDRSGFTVLETGGSTEVSESGTTDALSVVLTMQPATPVVFTIHGSDAGETSVGPSTITFTPQSWSTPQSVTVTGVDDALNDGDQVSTLRVSVDDDASDDAFDALADRVISVTTLDDERAAFAIAESGGSTRVSESGTTDTFTVTLATRPTSTVVFRVTTSDAGEATASPPSLTFAPASWDAPQTVTVTGVDDAAADGEQISLVTVSVDAASSDDAFDGLADATVSVATADDDQAGFTIAESGGSTSVSESGTSDAFTVALTMAPALDVVFDLAASDAGEAAVTPSSLTFTSANWSLPQTVTVTGVDDAVVDGSQLSTVRIAVNDAASDNAFDPLADRTVPVTTADDDLAGFTVAETGSSTSVSESGTSDAFTVVLTTAPASNVVFAIAASDAGEATVVPASLTFTSANWSLPQTVTVTGVDDPVVDGNQVSTVRVSIDDAASDDAFDPVADRILSVTTTDDDRAAFTVVESGDSTAVSESGTSDAIVVALSTQPSSDVVFVVTASDASEATVNRGSLTFTPTNWSQPQIVSVIGVDDSVVDGPQTSTVTVSVNDGASDDAFDALADEVVTVTTTDDDVVGIDVRETANATVVSEAGRRDTLSVALTAQPAGNVVLTITSSDTGEATVAPASLTFTPADWSTPKAVIVSGVYDLLPDGEQTVDLRISVSDAASDDAFDPVADVVVPITVLDSALPG